MNVSLTKPKTNQPFRDGMLFLVTNIPSLIFFSLVAVSPYLQFFEGPVVYQVF